MSLRDRLFTKRFLGFLIVVGLIFGAVIANTFISRQNYNRDVTFVYSFARQLGYTDDRYIDLKHSSCGGDCYYDIIELVYSTDQSLSEFISNIQRLGLQITTSFGPQKDNTLLLSLNINRYGKQFRFRSEKSNEDESKVVRYPVVSSWTLRREGHLIDVRYGSSDVPDAHWYFGDDIKAGNLVIVSYDRIKSF